MSEMKQRIMRAIANGVGGDATFGEIADMVLAAMREPTKEMRSAASMADWNAGYDAHHQNPRTASHIAAWEAMIDAALNEAKP